MENTETIRAFLRQNYPTIDPLQVQPIRTGLENHSYLLHCPAAGFILRVYSPRHTTTGPRHKNEIEFELRFMAHLRSRGVPAPAVIPNREGELVSILMTAGQPRCMALFEKMPGEEPLAYTPEIAASVAQTLLEIRRSSLDFQYKHVRKWPGNILEQSLSYYQENRDLTGAYKDTLDAIFEVAAEGYERMKKGLPTGIIHGDIKLENLLVQGSRVSAVLDFDDYRESYLLEELTRTLMHDLDSPTRNPIRGGQLPVFRQIFARDPSISQLELKALATFLRARFVYDVTVYLSAGSQQLVDELFQDKNVREGFLSK